MKKFLLKSEYSISFAILLAMSFVTTSGFAENMSRDEIIQRELDCITNAQKNSPTFSWSNVCYADTENVPVKYTDDSERPFELKFEASTGYRRDYLQFNIAGNSQGTSPNILSELTWKNIQSWQIKGKGQMIFNNHIVLDGSGDYGQIFSGDNQDSDYLGDDRTFEFSRSNNNAKKGNLYDFSGGLGYRFLMDDYFTQFAVDKASVTPLVGYAYNAQNLHMTDGYQTLDPYGYIGFTGPFSGLNSKYETQWYGPWLGFEMEGKLQRFTGLFRFEYHFTSYYAQANWNLRDDLAHPKSFEHKADGSGYTLGTELGYELTENWQVNLGLDFYTYKTKHGTDTTFLSDGTSDSTQLNVVNWHSYSTNLGLKYSWR